MGIYVGAVGRTVEQLGSGGFDESLDPRPLWLDRSSMMTMPPCERGTRDCTTQSSNVAASIGLVEGLLR